MWPVVERAIEFVLRYQYADGTIAWSLDSLGRRESYALLTGSSSIFHSLRCAVALAERFDVAKPAWELAAGRLGHAVAHHPGAFAPKNEFAMDWYYPIFSGAIFAEAGLRRVDDGWERHVMDGLRSAMRVDERLGDGRRDRRVRVGARRARPDESRVGPLQLRVVIAARTGPWTGIAYPSEVTFPDRETTSYTTAAIILAADALTSSSEAAGLFRHDSLPMPIDLAEPGCPLPK